MENTEMDENFVRAPYLVKIYGDNLDKKFLLYGQKMQIGRLPDSHIRINSVNISRRHCTLNCVSGKWTIKDNNSQNGTYVNGRRLKPNQVVTLQIEDIIFLGPPSENPQAFRYDDFLSQREHMLITRNTRTEDKEFSKESNTQPNTESISLAQSSVGAEIKSTQEEININNVFASSKNKNTIKVPDIAKQIDTSDKKDIQSSKLSSNIHAHSDENKRLDKVVQVADDSQSLLEIKSDNMCDEELYSLSQKNSEFADNKHTFAKRVEDGVSHTKRNSEDSDSEHLRTKIALLSEEVKRLEESKSELLKEYESVRNKDKMLDDALAEQRRLKEEMLMCETRVKDKFKTQIMEKLEEELICNICTEVLIKPTVLDCSHTFCEYCITQWKKQKGQCPICRNKIKTQTRVLALDDFIDKTLESLTPDQKEKRKQLTSQREQVKSKSPSERKRRKRRRSAYSRRRHNRVPSESIVIIDDITNGVVPVYNVPDGHIGSAATSSVSAYAWVPDIFLSDSENESAMAISIED